MLMTNLFYRLIPIRICSLPVARQLYAACLRPQNGVEELALLPVAICGRAGVLSVCL